jgi:hypothetical protein
MNESMKTNMNHLSTKVIAGMLLIGCGLLISGQSFAQAPAWTVSKGVQKVSNKQMFEDKELTKSHIHALVLNETWMISKSVHSMGRDNVVGLGNIRSTGTSDWAISKGVHQIKTNKPVMENKDLFKTGPEITRQGE